MHMDVHYSLSTMNPKMKNGELTKDDVITHEDMFTPGIECLVKTWDRHEYRTRV